MRLRRFEHADVREEGRQLLSRTVAAVRHRATVMGFLLSVMHRARVAIFRSDGCRLVTGGLFGFRFDLRRVRFAAFARHERRQRRDLAEEPGERDHVNAPPDCGHVYRKE